MNPPRILDIALLDELGARLRGVGAPAIEAARDGLTESAMHSAAGSAGLTLPLEARVWWGWRDGVAVESGPAAREIGPGRKWLPLDEALQECASIRQMNADGWRHDPARAEESWQPTWLPLVHSEAPVVIDTGVPDDAPCPVLVHLFHDLPRPPQLQSLAQLVEIWIDAIDRGAWRYDRAGDHWIRDAERLERGVAGPGIA